MLFLCVYIYQSDNQMYLIYNKILSYGLAPVFGAQVECEDMSGSSRAFQERMQGLCARDLADTEGRPGSLLER